MFSFRRKPSKRSEDTPAIRVSPSLPELNSHGIPWPESLVDIDTIRENSNSFDRDRGGDRQPDPGYPRTSSAAKTSLQGPGFDRTPIPFHKPFRVSTNTAPQDGLGTNGKPISSLYMSNEPPTFDTSWKSSGPRSAGKMSQRRTGRTPPTFNLMVAGGQGTGKTSLLRLLLETADLSPTATVDQRAAMDRFLRGPPKTTTSIETAVVEICESRFDRILFSVIDTPGLDFLEGRELKLERQVSSIIKYLDTQYADTMSEESKVVRQSKGDQHVHLCIYLIEPSSIMSAASRGMRSVLPTKTRSETTVSQHHPPDLVPDVSDEADSDEEDEAPLTMSPAEIRVIRRLSARTNVLPVIAKADSLTDETLLAAKDAVRRGLAEAGLDFGVFGPKKVEREREPSPARTPKRQTHFATNGRNGDGRVSSSENGEAGEDDEEDEERKSRPVIKLRPSRHASRGLSRSRSRRDLSRAADDERRPLSPDATDADSVANVRFSAQVVARTDLSSVMPFALISPEPKKPSRRRASISGSEINMSPTAMSPVSPVQQSEDGHLSIAESFPASARAPTPSASVRTLSYLDGPPEDLKGVFVRKFRWGTVDVLNPSHCDFAALRTAVLSTHLKVLKIHTKEVLYEKYRTEKLLARRATSQITDDERQRLLEDLGL